MMYDQDVGGSNLMQTALSWGLTEIIPVIPPNALLAPDSNVDVSQLGKVPGSFSHGYWDATAQWPEMTIDANLAAYYDSHACNVGVKCGYQVAAFDVDILDDLTMQAVRQTLLSQGVTAPCRVGQAPKALWLFRVSGEPIRRRQYPITHKTKVDSEGKPLRAVVDVMGISAKGRPTQCVILGNHPSGSVYTWDKLPIFSELPTINQEGMDALVESVLGLTDTRDWQRGRPSSGGGSGQGRTSAMGLPRDLSLVTDILNVLPNPDMPWDEYVRVGMLIQTLMGQDEGWPYWLAWCQRSAKYEYNETEKRWLSLEPEGTMTFGTLVQYARDLGVMTPGLDSRVASDHKWRQALAHGMPEVPAEYVAPLILPGTGVTPSAPPRATMPTATEGPMPDSGQDYTRKSDGSIIACFANIALWIQTDPQWKDCFAVDAFANRAVVLSPIPGSTDHRVPRELTDNDYLLVRKWFERNGFPKIAKSDVIDAVDNVAIHNSFEPVQSYLTALPAVAGGLIDTWIHRFLGVPITEDPNHNRYVQAVGRKWLISAVARAMNPGCQADHALVLEGRQGAGKSSALRALCPDEAWFGDSLPNFHDKDASEYLDGKWIVEMAELASMRKSELEDMRSFLTRRYEEFRPAYGRKKVYRPRRCVFSGSTNRDDYLKDGAGERRIWPVHVGIVDVDGLIENRDALWREAYDAYMAGEGWHLDADIASFATTLQRERVERDPWQDMIEDQIVHLNEVTPLMLYRNVLGLPHDKWNQGVSRRISGVLTSLGFKRNGVISGGEFRNKPRWIRE